MVDTRPLHPNIAPLKWHDIDAEVGVSICNQLFDELRLVDRKTHDIIVFLQPRAVVMWPAPSPQREVNPG